VAIKQAELNGIGGCWRCRFDAERAFRTELLLLSHVNHYSLVQLLAFYGKRIPVFEFILSTARSMTTYTAAAVTAY
jgi:hypothetical protein